MKWIQSESTFRTCLGAGSTGPELKAWRIAVSSNEEMLAELRKIRELLTQAPPPPPPPAPKGISAEFKAFLSTYKVLGLAVAFILGLYLGMLVQALVKDLILPVIGIPLSSVGNLSTLRPGHNPVPFTTLRNLIEIGC